MEKPFEKQVWHYLWCIFGKAFIREYGETIPDLWKQTILSFTQSTILKALDAIQKKGFTYPINLSQFTQICHENQICQVDLDFKAAISVNYYDEIQDPRIQQTIKKIGWHKFRNLNESEAYEKFKDAYYNIPDLKQVTHQPQKAPEVKKGVDGYLRCLAELKRINVL